MYLIDANVLISADAHFYPLNRIPQFWDWLIDQGALGNVKIPAEIHDEVSSGKGALAAWTREGEVKKALLLEETLDPALVRHCLQVGYQSTDPRFTDRELQKIGRDAFLVAYGLAGPNRVIVTREVSKRTKRLGASKLPDACDDCGVRWTSDFEMYRILNFNLSGR
ncbi:DUF4411 family protein [uncultured Jannaschia sp.]|uniref:DUF4411 family protein n=1 Tax=uncultured Jannaschia sp. TaxID=293347 RepID=UPI0026387F8A|nr:DUF4411 family protein [uncultured Jannaschia sp.]